MTTLKQEAEEYVPKETLNIADLDKVSVDIELLDGDGIDKDGKPFSYKYAVIDGKEYRIASTVIGGLKGLLEKIPNLKYICVDKQGSGMNTRYQVIPITTA